jgi:hypothetical protein
MSNTKKFNLSLFVVGLLVSNCLHSTYAQPDDSVFESGGQVSDTIFEEILLSEESVTAVDTAGDEWYYDFEKEVWVSGNLPGGSVDDRGEGRVVLTGDEIPVEERCTEEKRVKRFERSPVWVSYEEYVDDNIFAYGRVTIRGWVKGDVKSLKKVFVSASGRVDGDIEAPKITVKEGGMVLGERRVISSPLELEDITKSFSADGLIVVLSFTTFLLVFSFLTVSLMPRQMRNFDYCLSRHKVKTFLLGLLFLVLMPVILLLVMITVVGLIVVPFVPLVYLIAFGLGIVAFGNMLGRQFSIRYLGGEKGMLLQSMLGIVLLMSLWFIVAVLLGAGDEVSQGFGIFFLVVSILLTSFPILAGVGAAVLTRFGFKEYRLFAGGQQQPEAPTAPAPAPPPIPEGPSLTTPPAGPETPRATPPPSPRIPEGNE